MDHDVERFSRWAPTYDRHFLQRFVFEPVQQKVLALAVAQVPRPKAILDVGCGTGRLLRTSEQRFPDARLEGVDAAEGMVNHARAMVGADSRIKVQQATAEQLPFPDSQFDLVFSTMTFHHWADQPRAIAEVARVLTPTGRWLLADFIATGVMRYIRRLLRLKHVPERAELEAMLATAGLRVVAEGRVQRRISLLAIGRRG